MNTKIFNISNVALAIILAYYAFTLFSPSQPHYARAADEIAVIKAKQEAAVAEAKAQQDLMEARKACITATTEALAKVLPPKDAYSGSYTGSAYEHITSEAERTCKF